MNENRYLLLPSLVYRTAGGFQSLNGRFYTAVLLAAFLAAGASGGAAQEPEAPSKIKSKTPSQAAVNPTSTVAEVKTDVSAEPSTTPAKISGGEMTERERSLIERIEKLEKRLEEIESRSAVNNADNARETTTAATNAATTANKGDAVTTAGKSTEPKQIAITETDRSVLDFFRDTTINFSIDGNYVQNFNRPYNRQNLLRAYDTTSNSFNLNQANVVFENAPDVEKGRRFGFRLDLQYGQATQTLQGSPNNETRPKIYRPVWQAYGTYVAPIGKGLTLDFGKFASSLGYETNYTKDNFNYSRSYFFNYLPYYHFGLRAAYPVTKKLTATYWLVNGAQQSEDFNSSKSQAILLTYKPTEKVILQGNYYVGREQRDQNFADANTSATFDVTRGRITPKGRFHVLDAYATFLLSDKTTFALEGDYVINRVDRRDAPSRVTGGVAYLRHQFTPKFAVAGRGEYLSDRGGLFSGATQALKEVTLTGEYKFAEGFLLRGEYRRDWSNQPYFLTNDFNVLKKEQNTATVGFVWWFGRKQGAW